MKKTRIALLLGVVGILAAAPQAATAAGELIDATPATVAIQAPAPGETRHWEMKVENLTEDRIPLTMNVTGESDGLFDGSTPLQLELRDTKTSEVVFAGPARSALNTIISLPGLTEHESYALTGTVTLPSSAGNEYQDATGSLTFEFTTMVEPAKPSGLAVTGGVMGPWLWISLILVIGGGVLLVTRRRSKA